MGQGNRTVTPAPARLSRTLKLGVLWALKICGGFYVARRYNRGRVRILCYHGVWIADDKFDGDQMFIRPQTFESRLRLLSSLQFEVISLDHAVEGLGGRKTLPDDAVVITIDDGWFGTFAHMVPALRRHGMPATLYCDSANLLSGTPVWHVMARYLANIHGTERSPDPQMARLLGVATDPAASSDAKRDALAKLATSVGIELEHYVQARAFSYMSPAELRQAAATGLSIELHTHNHSLHNFEPEKIAEEIETNRAVLGEALGREPRSFTHFCYPSGATAPGVEQALERLGIRSGTTLIAGLAAPADDPLLLPRIIDGDQRTALEFEAELCGISALLRTVRQWLNQYRLSAARPFQYAPTQSSPY
jgi:peptidoglycan/xylan/chitin deacetylase (PgdA/CDA1 family)